MDKINKFAELVERETIENFKYDYPGWERHCRVTVIPGRKYTAAEYSTIHGLRCPVCKTTHISVFVWDGESEYPE